MREKEAVLKSQKTPSVEIILVADDIRVTIERFAEDNWYVKIEDTGYDAPDFDEALKEYTMVMDTPQVAAALALFAGIGENVTNMSHEITAQRLYEIVKEKFDGVPSNLRFIP